VDSYQSLQGQPSCTPCQSGASTLGLTGVTSLNGCKCIKGYGWSSPSTCTQCSINTYKSTNDQTACINCPNQAITNGVVGAIDISSCICPAGYYGLAGQACVACPQGRWKSFVGAATSCTACVNSSTTPTEASTLISQCTCPTGQTTLTNDPSQCQLCAANSYKDSISYLQCTSCATGTSTQGAQGGTSKEACLCPAGRYTETNGSCTLCQTGRYQSLSGQPSCLSCPSFSGTNSTTGASSITKCLCTAGSSSSSSSSTTCFQCAAGSYTASVGVVGCSTCPEGRWSNITGATSCAYTCPPTTSTDATLQTPSSASACFCDRGYELKAGTCTSCTAGQYKARVGPQSCDSCPIGFYFNGAQATVCSSCGYYSTTSATGSISQSSCQCAIGSTGPDGTGPCTPCSTGKYKTTGGSTGVCSNCAAGRYGSSMGLTSSNCTAACPFGSNSVAGSQSINDCACIDGYTGSAGVCLADSCRLCLSAAACFRVASTYYCAGYIVGSSVVPGAGMSYANDTTNEIPSFIADSTNGGQEIQFGVFRGATPAIKAIGYRSSDGSGLNFECLSWEYLLGTDNNVNTVKCVLKAGTGTGFHMYVVACITTDTDCVELTSNGTFTFAFPSPSINSGSLFFPPNGEPGVALTSDTTFSIPIAFRGSNFYPPLASVVYGPSGIYTCTVSTALSTSTLIYCLTQANSVGTVYFTLLQPTDTVEGTDSLRFPAEVPVITRVSGCTDAGNATSSCKTDGGTVITLYGITPFSFCHFGCY
jgi:hypothetical protein